jgi:hypothetical protein
MKTSISFGFRLLPFLSLSVVLYITSLNYCFSQPIWKMDLRSNCKATGVLQDYDNGYLISGSTTDNYYQRGVIIKTDINGNERYTVEMKAKPDKSLVLGSIAGADANTFLVAGSVSTDNYKTVPFVTKFNTCKKVEWCLQLDVANYPMQCADMVRDSTGNFLCLFNPLYNQYDSAMIFVAKISTQGELLWINQYFTDTLIYKYPAVNYIIPTRDGGFVLSGEKGYSPPNHNWHFIRPLWAKFDSTGNEVWNTTFYPNVPYYIWNGGVSTQGFEEIDGTIYCSGGGGYMPNDAGCFYKLAKDGSNVEWHLVSPTFVSFYDLSTTITKTNQNELLISNAITSNMSPRRIIVSKVDTSGNLKSRYVNYEDQFTALEAIKTTDGKLLFCGNTIDGAPGGDWYYTASLEKYDTSLTSGLPDTVTRIYDDLCLDPIVNTSFVFPDICSSISIPETGNTGVLNRLQIYPNPGSDYVIIQIPEYSVDMSASAFGKQQQYKPLVGEVLLLLKNMNGQTLIHETIKASERNHILYISTINQGFYVVELSQKGKVVAQGKVVVVR